MASDTSPRRGRILGVALPALPLVPLALALLAACGQGGASLPPGWSLYNDPQYPFQVPIAPGWSTAAYLNTTPRQGDCEYTLSIFPPGVRAASEPAAEEHQPEIMHVNVRLACPAYSPESANAGWTAEGTQVQLSSVATTLFKRSHGDGSTDRIVVATFGGHQYGLYMQAPADKATQDEQLYMTMLRGFKYTGPAS